MKTFELPVSDCGCIVVGEIGPDSFHVEDGEKPFPKHGIIIWYEDADTVRAASIAACEAHYSDEDGAA